MILDRKPVRDYGSGKERIKCGHIVITLAKHFALQCCDIIESNILKKKITTVLYTSDSCNYYLPQKEANADEYAVSQI